MLSPVVDFVSTGFAIVIGIDWRRLWLCRRLDGHHFDGVHGHPAGVSEPILAIAIVMVLELGLINTLLVIGIVSIPVYALPCVVRAIISLPVPDSPLIMTL